MLIKTTVIVLVFLMLAMNVSAQISSFSQITVTLINQEPDPVAPGNTVELRFRIENEGGKPAENTQAKLVLKYPFSLYGDEELKNLGTIAGSQTGDIGVREKWNLFVDTGATTGDHTVEFWYSIDGGIWTKAGDYTVTVRSRDAVLAINQIKTDRDNIIPGTMTQVSFVLENLADNTLNDIKLNLDLYEQITLTTTVSVIELPFTPIGSGNEKTLKSLRAGESKEIVFNLFTDADAESKAYKVPYTLTYSDSSGENFSREGILGLLVESTPDISVNIESTEIYQAGAKGRVEIKIVNKGFTDIKFLDLTMTETEDFKIISNPEVYIGELDSDDYETAEYDLMVCKEAEDSVILPLTVEYRDANGNLYTKELPLELELFTGEELRQRTNGGGFPWGIVILVVAIVAVVVYIIRRRNKKKQKKA
ncbi:COG1361 S-layer family protein [Candidatus Woesearchaeota archaeon]|nr:COG1361 S-layer family protein [Candidatus Woesearchaeota archaeon]